VCSFFSDILRHCTDGAYVSSSIATNTEIHAIAIYNCKISDTEMDILSENGDSDSRSVMEMDDEDMCFDDSGFQGPAKTGVSLNNMDKVPAFIPPMLDSRYVSDATLAQIAQVKASQFAPPSKLNLSEEAIDSMFDSIRCYASNAVDTDDPKNQELKSTILIDMLRNDDDFMARIEPYVCEGLCAEELNRYLEGYQAGHTIYTLALNKHWIQEPVLEEDAFTGAIPQLVAGGAAVLHTDDDVNNATMEVLTNASILHTSYVDLHTKLTFWDVRDRSDMLKWINSNNEDCQTMHKIAFRILYLSEEMWT